MLSPPNEETVRCDVVCQSITLKNNTACQVISLLLTHIVDLYLSGYKTIPSVYICTRSGVVPHFTTTTGLHYEGDSLWSVRTLPVVGQDTIMSTSLGVI